jgi:hypothetical protein
MTVQVPVVEGGFGKGEVKTGGHGDPRLVVAAQHEAHSVMTGKPRQTPKLRDSPILL